MVVELFVPSEVPNRTPWAAAGMASDTEAAVAAFALLVVVVLPALAGAATVVCCFLWWCFFGTAALDAVTSSGIRRGTMNRDSGASLRSRAEDIVEPFLPWSPVSRPCTSDSGVSCLVGVRPFVASSARSRGARLEAS